MEFEFEWDSAKAVANRRKHAVEFGEATTVFADPLSITIADPVHSTDEERLVIFGMSARGRVLAVMHMERVDRIRIISAREATRGEREVYEEGTP